MRTAHAAQRTKEEKDKLFRMKHKKKCVHILMVILSVSSLFFGCGSAAETMAEPVPESESTEAVALSENETDAVSAEDGGAAAEDGADAEDTVSGNTVSDESSISENTVDMEAVPRPDSVKVKGIYVSGPVAGIAKMDELIDLVDRTELNAMVIDIKNDEGRVTYKMQSEQVLEIDAGVRYIPDIDELVAKCKEKNIYLIARIVAFRDPYLAERKPEWAVHTKGGEIFRDKNGLAWVNPYEREVWDYLVEIASQAGQAGFDEVQFDYIRFSTDVNESEVDYGPESESVDKIEIITEFTGYVYNQLAPQGVYVAADVFGTVIDNETDQAIVGQDYVQMAQHLDYICPMVYPSHYHNGAYGITVPDAEPYNTIYAAASASVQALDVLPEDNRAHVRMWLQNFTASWVNGHISYGPAEIRAQIKGAYDAGYDEWILWNAAVNYQPEAFLTDEEAGAERQRWEEERLGQPTEAGQPPGQPEAQENVQGPEFEQAETQKTEGVETETPQPPEIHEQRQELEQPQTGQPEQ